MAITIEKIKQAADDLNGRGTRPTLAAVRKLIGGGSYTTISEGINLWKQEQTQKAPVTPENLMPTELQAHLEGLGNQLWSLAIEKANNRLKSEQEEFAKRQSELTQQIDEAKELSDQMNNEIDSQKIAIESLQGEIEKQKKLLEEMQAQLNHEKTEHENYKKKIAEEANRNCQKLIKANKDRTESIEETKSLREKLARTQGKLEQIQEHNKILLDKLSGH